VAPHSRDVLMVRVQYVLVVVGCLSHLYSGFGTRLEQYCQSSVDPISKSDSGDFFLSLSSTSGITSLGFLNEWGILGNNKFNSLIDIRVIIGDQIRPMINN